MNSSDADLKLVEVAKAMLQGKMHLLEGCRKITSLRSIVSQPEHETLLGIRSVESETEHFVLGEMREKYAPDYLDRVDLQMEQYLIDAREDILTACREIIHDFS